MNNISKNIFRYSMTLSHALLLLLFFSFSSCSQDVPVPQNVNNDINPVKQTKKSTIDLLCNKKWVLLGAGGTAVYKNQYWNSDTLLQHRTIFYKDSTFKIRSAGHKTYDYNGFWLFTKDSTHLNIGRSMDDVVNIKSYFNAPTNQRNIITLNEDTLYIKWVDTDQSRSLLYINQ